MSLGAGWLWVGACHMCPGRGGGGGAGEIGREIYYNRHKCIRTGTILL
jgi:hypothetical protein